MPKKSLYDFSGELRGEEKYKQRNQGRNEAARKKKNGDNSSF